MRSTRTGAIIPVIVLAVVVMAILGTWLMWTSTSNYQQTARTAVALRIREVLHAALEEARAVAYDRLNRPGADTVWHRELVARLNAPGAGSGVLVTHDLAREALLPRTLAIATANRSELTGATAELVGFKRLSVTSGDLFEDGRIYYRDEDGVLDPPAQAAKLNPPVEWVGTLRVRVSARSGTTARQMTSVMDVKVVDINPPAREFALFSFLAARGVEHGPDTEDYWRHDLRRGAAMHIFGYGRGRIMVRGPFLVDTVGWTGGDGGKVPPRPTSSNQNPEWHGWAIVPANRDGIVTRAGPAVVNFGMPPMRPDTTDNWRVFVGLVTDRLGSTWTDWFNDDPGYYILNGQRWYAESTASDGSVFSICGRAGHFNTFRGRLVLYHGGARRVTENSDRWVTPGRVYSPQDDNQKIVIEPEGGLHGVYNVVQYYGDTVGGGVYQEYELTHLRQVQGRLGLHWQKKYTRSWLDQFVGDILGGGTILGPLGTLPRLLIPRSVADAASGLLLDLVGLNTRPVPVSQISRITADSIAGALPPGYRPPMRSVTRRHRRFADLAGQQRDGVPVILDGIVAFDELVGTRPFRYAGRGVIYSDARGPQSLVAPIVPATAGDPGALLTIHHEAPIERAHRGEAMLSVRGAGGPNHVVAHVYATQGLRPSTNLTLVGNLTCGYVNKSQFAGPLDLHYRAPPAAGPISAISFRSSLVLER